MWICEYCSEYLNLTKPRSTFLIPYIKATPELPRSRKGSLAVTVKVGTVHRKSSWTDFEVGGVMIVTFSSKYFQPGNFYFSVKNIFLMVVFPKPISYFYTDALNIKNIKNMVNTHWAKTLGWPQNHMQLLRLIIFSCGHAMQIKVKCFYY